MFFAVKAFFCLCVCVRASERVCLKSTCREKGLICYEKRPRVLKESLWCYNHLGFFPLRCVQLQRSHSKPRRQSSPVKARPFVLNRQRTMKRMMRCWIKQWSCRLVKTKTRTNQVFYLRAIKPTATSKVVSELFQIVMIFFSTA